MQERETQREMNERIDKLAQDVLRLTKNTIFTRMRFLDMALNQLEFMPMKSVKMATDGKYFLYNGRWLLYAYNKEKEAFIRNYLHLTFHCIFRHMYVHPNINRDLWNLSCDMAVEAMITDLQLPMAKAQREEEQGAVLSALRQEVMPFTADKLYYYLQHNRLSETKLEQYSKLFRADDHVYWYPIVTGSSQGGEDGSKNEACDADGLVEGAGEKGQRDGKDGKSQSHESGDRDTDSPGQDDGGQSTAEQSAAQQLQHNGEEQRKQQERDRLQQRWQDIAERMQTELETFGKQQSGNTGDLVQALARVNREKVDYGTFLKKFATRGEVMQLDDDEFDYIAYTYGLQLYKKMPLIEPLEYKEVKKIKEFVIAIDTSGSVAGDLVQKFVQKTYQILENTESFFSTINLHIVQCDEQIKEHVKITNKKEFDDYLEHMTLRGFGGTDFRPVFTLVDELIRNKEFENLKGLIYFTDGQGTYPARKPDYLTAFVFLDGQQAPPQVPSWAISLVLEEEDIQ